jgi:hypothetical protein
MATKVIPEDEQNREQGVPLQQSILYSVEAAIHATEFPARHVDERVEVGRNTDHGTVDHDPPVRRWSWK